MRRQLLAAGVAAGFGSVFGTPIAGAIFGLEFVVLGRIEYDALVPALVASLVGDLTTRRLGIVHAAYPPTPFEPLTVMLLLTWAVFALAVTVATTVFIELIHFIKRHSERVMPRLPLRMAVGGMAIVALWRIAGTEDYLGLGLPVIASAFVDSNISFLAFAWKGLFTAITLGTGFLGGEVTPLFFVGATLGHSLARPLDLPVGLAAGVGLAAVFAASANTPLALSIMAVELLGGNVLPHVIIVAVLAYLLSGHRSIYPAQRLLTSKSDHAVPLREWTRAAETSSLEHQ